MQFSKTKCHFSSLYSSLIFMTSVPRLGISCNVFGKELPGGNEAKNFWGSFFNTLSVGAILGYFSVTLFWNMWFSVAIFCPTLEKKFGLSRFKLGPKKEPGKSFLAKSLDFLDLTNTFSFLMIQKAHHVKTLAPISTWTAM